MNIFEKANEKLQLLLLSKVGTNAEVLNSVTNETEVMEIRQAIAKYPERKTEIIEAAWAVYLEKQKRGGLPSPETLFAVYAQKGIEPQKRYENFVRAFNMDPNNLSPDDKEILLTVSQGMDEIIQKSLNKSSSAKGTEIDPITT